MRSLVAYDGYEVEYTPSIMPPAESEALFADARDPQGPAEKPSGSGRSPIKTSAPVSPLQFFQGPMPTDRKQGGKPPGGPPPGDDGNGDGEAMKTMVMALGPTSAKKLR